MLFAVISIVFGYTAMIQPTKSTNPAYPNHCFDNEANAYYMPRKEGYNRKGMCEHIFCLDDYSMSIHG